MQFYSRCRQTGLRQPVSRGKRPFRTTSKTPSANALRIGPEAAPPRPSAAVSAAIVVHPIPTAGTAKEPNNLRRHTLRSEGVKKLQILRRGYWAFRKIRYLCPANGGLAQLARALAWHARGHEFESRILHQSDGDGSPANIHLQGFIFSRVTRPNVDKRILPAAYSGHLASPKKQAGRIRTQCVVLHNFTPAYISGGGVIFWL